MNQKFSMKPLALALGATFALGGAAAQASMFQMSDLASGYMVASAGDTKAGEQKCGEKGSNCDKDKGAKAGECVCGAAKGKKADGKCGEGKCGADKKKKEGKCGEGKCGADKKK